MDLEVKKGLRKAFHKTFLEFREYCEDHEITCEEAIDIIDEMHKLEEANEEKLPIKSKEETKTI